MLNDPPCISPLVGCTDADAWYADGGGSESSTYSVSSSSSSLRSDTSFSSSRSSNLVSSARSTASSLGSLFALQAQRFAKYTVTARNKAQQAIKGFTFSHGPIPSGAVFDPTRSTPGCSVVGTSVQCTADLDPGQSTSFTLAYKASSAVSCALSRKLQQVTEITSFGSSVSSVVSCSMANEMPGSGAASSSHSSSSSAGLASVSGTGSFGWAANEAMGTTTTPYVVQSDDINGNGKGKGYKPYSSPRTGGTSDAFSALTQATFLKPVVHTQSTATPDLWISGFMVISAVFVAILSIVAFRVFRMKTAVSEQ